MTVIAAGRVVIPTPYARFIILVLAQFPPAPHGVPELMQSNGAISPLEVT